MNSKWAKREVALTIWHRKIRAFQKCIRFYCTFIGVSYTENPGYTPENSKSGEKVVVLAIKCRKIRAFQVCMSFYSPIIGVSCTKNPGYTLGNPKWAERVVVLAVRCRKSRAFQICVHFQVYFAIIGVSFAELKMIKAFQWIPLSKEIHWYTLLLHSSHKICVPEKTPMFWSKIQM